MSVAAKQQVKGKAKRTRVSALRGFPLDAPNAAKTKRVDKAANVIRGYKVMSLGEALGHGNEVDSTTLSQIAELGQAAGERGVKSRFTHPALSGDGLGSYLGRTKNFRIVGDSVLGDLFISDRAFDTPNGNLGQYVLDMAESEPDQFGASVVISHKNEYRLNEDGTRKTDKDGNELLPVIRVTTLHASDIVDEPAANSGFFAVVDDSLPDHPSRQATAFLDRLFGNSDAEEISERVGHFLTSYLQTKGQKMPEATPQTATPAVEKPAVSAITEAQLSAAAETASKEAIKAERERSANIMALCNQAGKPELAAGFVESDKSVADVQAHLFNAICQERKPADGGAAPVAAPEDENTPYRKEYAAKKAIYSQSGLSEADYIATRRIDDGLDTLTFKAA